MGKVHLCVQCLCDFLVLTELQSVIEGYRVAHVLVVIQQRDDCFADFHSLFRKHLFRQIETGLSLRQRHDCTGTLFTQYQVSFPVSQALTCINDRRTQFNRYGIRDTASLLPVPLTVASLALPQVGIQISTSGLISSYILVNPFVADR